MIRPTSVLFLFSAIVLSSCGHNSSEPPGVLSEETGTTQQGSLLKQGDIGTYEITLENLAPATGPGSSQPLSPPVIASHSPSFRLFHVGGFASHELRQIAEDAFNDPMLTFLNSSDQVHDVEFGGPPILPGESATYTIQASTGFHKISLVTMLVNTNDGFTGVDKVTVPEKGSKVFYLRAYDAGTEENTELAAHIPGPCCGNPFVRVPTRERIRFHRGIRGSGDLDPAVYGWNEPVAKLTITRTG
ncbi:MAG: spondin domain-containing protein [Ignavibacteria bacterium]|nr:spondin domain-containing protein [Ignavibacteria bacterium]